MNWKSTTAIAASAVLVGGALSVTAITSFADDNPKEHVDLWAGLSDAEKEAEIAEAHTANLQFLERFLKSGQDARSLPRREVSDWAAPPDSLAEGLSGADLVVRGRVTAVDYRPDGGWIPLTIASVKAESTIVDRQATLPAGADLVVIQVAGPTLAEGERGTLMYLESEQPIFPGDEAIFVLRSAPDGTFYPVPGAGVYRIEGGAVYAQHGNPVAASLDGTDAVAFGALLQEAAARSD